MTKSTIVAFLFCFLILPVAPGRVGAGGLHAPLVGRLCPTSSFGSWRQGHFHAGVDFSTGGVTGLPVLAVDTCWVWRIRIWNGGYGKALYTQLSDGRLAVYGHLSRFSPSVEALVEDEQDLRRDYQVEIYCEPLAFTFLPGDTIGFSGDTGSGPPHLHFELRSGRHDHSSLNPLPDHIDIDETLPPTIRQVRLTPLKAKSAIDERYDAVMIQADAAKDTLRISGPFGLSVYAVDSGLCDRRLSPALYEATIDGKSVWRMRLDEFPFSKTHFSGAYHERIGGRSFVRLDNRYDLDMRGFSCRQVDESFFRDSLAFGPHLLELRVGDASGNMHSIHIPFFYGVFPEFRDFSLLRDSVGVKVRVSHEPADAGVEVLYREHGGSWQAIEPAGEGAAYRCHVDKASGAIEVVCKLTSMMGFQRDCILSLGGTGTGSDSIEAEAILHSDFIEIRACSDRAPSSLPAAEIHEGALVTETLLQPVGEHSFRAVYFPKRRSEVVHIRTTFEFGQQQIEKTVGQAVSHVGPGSVTWLLGQDFRIGLLAPGDGISGSLLALKESDAESYEGFDAAAGRLAFLPEGIFFGQGADILIVPRSDRGMSKHGVFAERGKHPVFLARFDSSGVCRLKLHALEPLVVLEDQESPAVEWIGKLRRRSHDGKATFTARVIDRGSGVNAGTIKAYVDDDMAIVSYDYDTALARGRTTKPLRYGRHRIRLEAEDWMGNVVSSEHVADLVR
jgi:hypothetical protein